jgi:hypothetical protein
MHIFEFNVIKEEGAGGNVHIWLQMEELSESETEAFDNIILFEEPVKK